MTRTEEITAAANREHLPGDGHMWVMVLGDLVIFAGYFVIFAVHRAMNRDEFLQAQQHLAINIGVLNTVVLLSSSWFIARAVLATRAGRHQAAVRHLYAGGTLGVAFWRSRATSGSSRSTPGTPIPRCSSRSTT